MQTRMVRASGLQTPGAAASPPTTTSLLCLPSDCVIPCSMAAMFVSVRSSFARCPSSYGLDHHPGIYPHLDLKLCTRPCRLCVAAAAVRSAGDPRGRTIGCVWNLSECVRRVLRSCGSPRVYVEPLGRCMCLVYVQNSVLIAKEPLPKALGSGEGELEVIWGAFAQ